MSLSEHERGFLPREPDVLRCGCELNYRESEHGEVALIFLTPCSEPHRQVAEHVRGRGGIRTSSLVVKSVK